MAIRRRLLWIALAAAAIAIVLIVVLRPTIEPEGEESALKIGAVLPLTGPAASLGRWIQNGYTLAAERIERDSTSLPTVRIIIEDGMSDPRSSLSAFNKLVETDRVEIVTTALSPVTLAILPLAKERNVIVFAAAAHPSISGYSDRVFRHNLTVAAEVDVALNFVQNQLRPRKPRLIYMNDDYGVAFKTQWEQNLSGATPLQAVAFDRSTPDLRGIAVTALAGTPDCIVVVGYGQALGTLVRRLREQGYQGAIVTNNGLPYPDVLAAAGDAAEGVFYVDYDINRQDPEYIELSREYQNRFNQEMPPVALFEHNTIVLIARTYAEANGDLESFVRILRNRADVSLPGEKVRITPEGDIIPILRMSRMGEASQEAQ